MIDLNSNRPSYIMAGDNLINWPRSEELQMQKLKSHQVRTQSLNVLLLKPGVGQYMAVHAMLPARDLFLTYFYPYGPFTCIFFQNLSQFFPVLAVADTGSCVGPHNKICLLYTSDAADDC